MWSIAFVAVAKSLILLNPSVPAVASQLSHSLQRHRSFPTASALACGTVAISTSPAVPSRASGRAQASSMSSLKRECPRGAGRRSGMQRSPCTAVAAGAGALRKQLEGVCHPRVQQGGGQRDLQVPHIIHPLQVSQPASSPASPQREGPKAPPLHQGGGLGWGMRGVWRLLIPRAKTVLLWGIFFLSSNQWKCVYQKTVFGLDKCFSDVNKAGERDGVGENR